MPRTERELTVAAGIRVLIVDDDDLVRITLRRIVGRQPDLEVAGEATDGAEAVELARDRAPDVILMDVQMPGVTGVDATRELRRLGVDTPILFLTADPSAVAGAGTIAGVRTLVKAEVGVAETLAAVREAAAGR